MPKKKISLFHTFLPVIVLEAIAIPSRINNPDMPVFKFYFGLIGPIIFYFVFILPMYIISNKRNNK